MSDRYRRGLDVAEQLAADKLAHFVKSGVAEVALFHVPFLHRCLSSSSEAKQLSAVDPLAASAILGIALLPHLPTEADTATELQTLLCHNHPFQCLQPLPLTSSALAADHTENPLARK